MLIAWVSRIQWYIFLTLVVVFEMTLVESRDKCVREAAPVLNWWSAKKSVGKGCPSDWGYCGTGTAGKRGVWAQFRSS